MRGRADPRPSGGIDAIILDRRLPDGDGAEVCRTLKADAGTRALPVIVISGRAEDSSVGADAYFIKPVIPGDLLAVLDRLIARSGRAGS
ncbi:MAG: response regulator transcription factor [Candidatus Rokubacteria bacterium]|nr:response regulator transcription factor [Candidatus Rokubacteria bacterium]